LEARFLSLQALQFHTKFLNYSLLQSSQLCGSHYNVANLATKKLLKGLDAATSPASSLSLRRTKRSPTSASPQRYAGDIEIHRILASGCKGKQARSGVVSIASNLKCDLPLLTDFWRGCRIMSGSPLSFRHDSCFETMCSPVRTKQEWRCVWRRAKLKHPAFTLLIFLYAHAEQEYSARSEGTNGRSKSCPKSENSLSTSKHEETPKAPASGELL